tara:strand:- start:450 stop:641 length:192 start_codon:yes stop_codon:yes gene_type:complete
MMQKGDNMGYITTEEDKDKFLMHPKRFEALEKRVEILEKKHQELIDNLRIFMVNDEEEFAKEQ